MKKSLVFWMWNSPLNSDEIRRQIAEMHRQHIGGFFIHPMPREFRPKDFPDGMPGYLSEEYFDFFAVALESAKEHDMELWLYDEGGWPSGTLNGWMLRDHPELAMHQITADGEILDYAGLPDLLRQETTRIFIDEVHEKYRQHFASDFGKTIPGIFTDEPSFGHIDIPNALPWSPALEEEFRAVHGYDYRDAAQRILKGQDSGALRDFNQVWSSLMERNFMAPIAQWCHKNNLLFTGHFNGDDTVENMYKLLGSDVFSLHKHFDVPGCDAIWRQIHPLVPETDFSRVVASAAGNKPVISETFAVYGSDMSLAEMKQVAAMQFVSGITMVSTMALLYSNQGGRQVTTRCNLLGNDPRWDFYHKYSDFICNMSQVFEDTVPVIKATVPFPCHQLQGGVMSDVFAVGLKLAAQQITYDYQPDAPELPADIATDLQLIAPCPLLRTRHLQAPGEERRILVNASTETIRCTFKAPAGNNTWFDPANGQKSPACSDDNGNISLELPFGGVMVLLTSKEATATDNCDCGNACQPASTTGVAPLQLDFQPQGCIRRCLATPDGLRWSTAPADLATENHCGVYRFTATIECAAPTTGTIALPEARRAIWSLAVNGTHVDDVVWAPYEFCNVNLQAGKNLLTLDLTTTPAAAESTPEHIQWLKDNQYFKVYAQRCQKFAKLFPDEPAAPGKVFLKIREISQ